MNQVSRTANLIRAGICWLCAVLMLSLLIWMELENHHFGSFFPRKEFPVRVGHGTMLSFQKNMLEDEAGWRSWQGHLTVDPDLGVRPLTMAERGEMLRRLQENPRWNRFVDLVRVGGPVQVGLLGVCILVAMRNKSRPNRKLFVNIPLIICLGCTFEAFARGFMFIR